MRLLNVQRTGAHLRGVVLHGINTLIVFQMETHLERECGLTEVDCKYAHVGCQVMVN